MRWSLRGSLLSLASLLGCAQPSPTGTRLSPEDSTSVRATQEAYVSAWLADDTAGVMRTLAPRAVLMPPRTMPVSGDSAIRGYWWPMDGSRTRITSFVWSVDEVGGAGAVAYTRGVATLTWTYDKDTLHQTSTTRSPNLTVLRRQADGMWRISHQMWGPSLP